jgi:sugar transferase (PEP-CTERM/EpsH1 system associated)
MKTGLRILFVTPYVPSSVRVRPYAFIRELAARGHHVTLACLVQPAHEIQYLPQVAPYCEAIHPFYLEKRQSYLNTLLSLPTRVPLSVAYCRSAQFESLVARLVQHGEFDLLHTEFVRAAPVTARLNGHPKVYDAVDSLALAYRRSLSAAHVSPKQRMISLLEWAKLRRYEPHVMDFFDRVVVSSPADRTALECGGEDGVAVIPNGVDFDFFRPPESPRDPETLIFLGKMSYYVNISSVLWFYRQILPLIRKQRPKAKLLIVGREPAPKIGALAADPAVTISGTVEDVRPYLGSATVSICPMVSGSGIQNKMLEAMAMGAPVVATSLACQALQVKPGRDVLVTDTAEGFSAAVLKLLDDPVLRDRLAECGRRYVEQFHHWSLIGEKLETVYKELV